MSVRIPMPKIFISYAREDIEHAKRLAGVLAEHGIDAWWDRSIPPGRFFDDVIEEAINASQYVIVLWSQASVTSEWVRNEASAGQERGVLVPALIEANVRIPFAFRRMQAADLSAWNGDAGDPLFKVFLGVLTRRMSETVSTESVAQALVEAEESPANVVPVATTVTPPVTPTATPTVTPTAALRPEAPRERPRAQQAPTPEPASGLSPRARLSIGAGLAAVALLAVYLYQRQQPGPRPDDPNGRPAADTSHSVVPVPGAGPEPTPNGVAGTVASLAFVAAPTAAAVGVPVNFRVEARDASGHAVPGARVGWTVTDYAVALPGGIGPWRGCANGSPCTFSGTKIFRWGSDGVYGYTSENAPADAAEPWSVRDVCGIERIAHEPLMGKKKTCEFTDLPYTSGSLQLQPIGTGSVGVVAFLNADPKIQAKANMTVREGAVARWIVLRYPTSDSSFANSSVQVWPAALDAQGNTLTIPYRVTSSDPAVATVQDVGVSQIVLMTHAVGQSTITVAPDGKTTGPRYSWTLTVR